MCGALGAKNLPIGQRPNEWVGEQLHSGFGGKQQSHFHILIEEHLVILVAVFFCVIAKGDGCSGDHLTRQPLHCPSSYPGGIVVE